MIYSNCRQRIEPMRSLPPGSVICFGSTLHREFVLHTMFVIASAQPWTPAHLQLPGRSGAHTTAAIRAEHPRVQVLVLTTYDTDADITAAVAAGAVGYLLKDTGREQLCAAVRAAARGESVLSLAVAAKLLGRLRGRDREGLSGREIEVLTAVARGQGNKQVARALHISEATVKTHLLHIYAKLGVDDRTAAVTTALERGMIRLG